MNDSTDPLAGPLDPQLSELLPALNAAAPQVGPATSASELRQGFAALLALLDPPVDTAPFDGTVVDGVLRQGDVEVATRTWTPRGVDDRGDTVVYLHGGGWVLGGLDSAAPTARAIAERMHVRTVAVDYRLAPEHPFPAAFDDCFAVLAAERDRVGDAAWLAVAGDSAGGDLAAAAALAARDAGVRLDAQLLFYPALDPAMASDSHRAYADGYLLTGDAMRYYWSSYAGGADLDDPRLSPIAAPDLRGVAPAVVTTAGFDPLRDEGRDYAARLEKDGVTVVVLPQPALIHGWVDQVARIPAARQALDAAIAALEGIRRLEVVS